MNLSANSNVASFFLRCLMFTGFIFSGMAGSWSLHAQQDTIHVDFLAGERETLPSNMAIPDIVGYDTSGYYILSKEVTHTIHHFNDSLVQTAEERIRLPIKMLERDLEFVVHFYDTLYVFSTEKLINGTILYVQTIDKGTLELSEKERIFAIVNFFGGFAPEFGYTLSRQENKLLIHSKIDAGWSKVLQFKFFVTGKGLRKEWERTETVDYQVRPPEEYGYLVDEYGNAYMKCMFYRPSFLKSLIKDVQNKYLIISFTDQGTSFHKHLIEFTDLNIRGMQIDAARNQDLLVGGFFSDRINLFAANGIYFFRIDYESQQIRDRKLHKLAPILVEEAMELDPEDDNKQEIFRFDVDHMIRRANGNSVLIAEQIFDQNWDNFRNLVVVCFDPSGNINWSRSIRKLQTYNRERQHNYSSYTVLAPWYENSLVILYNHHLKNLTDERISLRSYNHPQKSCLACTEIRGNGQMRSFVISRREKRRFMSPMPLMSYDMKTNELLLPLVKWRKFKLAKLTFKNLDDPPESRKH